MSTNTTRELLYRDKAKISGNNSTNRKVLVFEHDNSVEFNKAKYPTYFRSDDNIKDVTLYAHTYVKIECLIQGTFFNFCDIVITDRFTMDSTRIQMKLSDTHNDSSTSAPKYYNKQIKNYSIAQYFDDQTNRIDSDSRINGNMFVSTTVVLSMADFPHFGDVYFQFYDDEKAKDSWCDPIIVQFTNAPTIYIADIYKWRPNVDKSTSAIEDYDNVFSSGFGAKLNKEPDTGRTNVLTGNADFADDYNKFMSANRLITNGICDHSESPKKSYSGHPVYMIEYVGFVPSSFSSAFGEIKNGIRQPVTFSAVGSAYLTSDYSTSLDDTVNLYTYTRDTDLFTAYTGISAVSSTNKNYNTFIPGSIRKFISHCAVDSHDKPNDKWFRKHTLVCADFALAGVAEEWM